MKAIFEYEELKGFKKEVKEINNIEDSSLYEFLKMLKDYGEEMYWVSIEDKGDTLVVKTMG